MAPALQNIYLNVPQTEVGFIMTLAEKMGWEVETKADSLRKYIATRPKSTTVSNEDILSELKAVRYK
jgi:hypothetical protein